MAAGEVQVAPDGTGKQIDAQSLTSTLSGSPTVYRQTVTLGDPTTFANIQKVNAEGEAHVVATFTPPFGLTQLFWSPNQTGLDTANLWTTAVVSSGAMSALSGSHAIVESGTTLGASATAGSKPTFLWAAPASLLVVFSLKFESGTILTNAHRFWGLGNPNGGSPSATTPMTDGIGFEIDTVGALNAAIYNNGPRTFVSALTPITDGAFHTYAIQITEDTINWFIDTFEAPVATEQYHWPTTNALPVRLQAANRSSGTAPTSSPQLLVANASVGSTSAEGPIRDATYPFRTVTVKPGLTAVVAADTPLAVGLHPSSPLPGGTNLIGSSRLRDASAANDATVKATTVAPAAADTTLVVGLHPNAPLPAGANAIGTVGLSAGTAVGLNTGSNVIGRVNADTSQAGQNITAASSFNVIPLGTLVATAPAAGTFVAFSTAGFDTASMVITGTFIGILNFEATIDGTNWFQIQAVRVGTNQVALSNQSAETGAWLIDCAGFSQVRARATAGAWTSGTATVYFYAADGARSDLIYAAPIEGQRATFTAVDAITLAASATDVFTIQGSANRTIRITRILLSGLATTAINAPISILRRTVANTGGTSAAVTPQQYDVLDPITGATCLHYTANPTALGAGVVLWRQLMAFQLTTSSQASVDLQFGNRPGTRAITLRGTSHWLAINLNATTVAGGVLDLTVEWTEEQ